MTKKRINGVLLLNKEIGISSNAALQKVKWLYNAAKAGHTGTLDPMATGLLPICFGEATKFSSFLLNANKEYAALIKLGVTTDTYDATGKIILINHVDFTDEVVKECIDSFIGVSNQIPPIYSALKVNGKALYSYARTNQVVEIKPRKIEIFKLEIMEFLNENIIKLRVLCSKGTYIRSLAHDIGQKLGCGASLVGLKRIKTNNFILNEDITIDYLKNLDDMEKQKLLLPIDTLVEHLEPFDLTHEQFHYVKNGHQFNVHKEDDIAGKLRLYYNKIFFGIANRENGVIKPERLVNTLLF
ncbi:MAG TPA: tRNA pseudouridine(55) synthase TruB [Burkholderiales bacterium]|nr:tRNA pseudouridine(55) synthase TruB [Burkholderiales bacterium]